MKKLSISCLRLRPASNADAQFQLETGVFTYGIIETVHSLKYNEYINMQQHTAKNVC